MCKACEFKDFLLETVGWMDNPKAVKLWIEGELKKFLEGVTVPSKQSQSSANTESFGENRK